MNIIKRAARALFASGRPRGRRGYAGRTDALGFAPLRPDAGTPLFRSRRPGPEDMPPSMKMWDATGSPEVHEDITATRTIPKIIPDGPEAAFIEMAYNDVDAACTAAYWFRKTRSVDVIVAGLMAYARRHPEETLTPVYA